MRRTLMLVAFLLAVGLIVGCANAPPPPAVTVTTAKGEDDEEGHTHSRDKMKVAHAGKLHAWLTAHLSSKEGNELDVFFETIDDDPKPVALPLAKFTAKARRSSDGKEFDLTFEPAPPNERPKGEAAGTCSHYVAKAPWMTADDELTVTAEVEVDGKLRKPKWKEFLPRTFAHHMD